MADSGLRRRGAIRLNWGDVDMQSGLVRVRQGKGKKDRIAVIGATVRRTLLAYRRTIENHADNDPLFQTREGGRFASDGFIQIFNRIKKQTGIHISPHVLRRTFTILSLRAGMDALHLQNLGVWSSLAMADEDLLQAHKAHSP